VKISQKQESFYLLRSSKSKEQREALETPNKTCKTFRDAIETISKLDFNLSVRGNQNLTF
jgi:hypothetical protein